MSSENPATSSANGASSFIFPFSNDSAASRWRSMKSAKVTTGTPISRNFENQPRLSHRCAAPSSPSSKSVRTPRESTSIRGRRSQRHGRALLRACGTGGLIARALLCAHGMARPTGRRICSALRSPSERRSGGRKADSRLFRISQVEPSILVGAEVVGEGHMDHSVVLPTESRVPPSNMRAVDVSSALRPFCRSKTRFATLILICGKDFPARLSAACSAGC